jgi:hypothetical protein
VSFQELQDSLTACWTLLNNCFDSEPLWVSSYSFSPDGKQIAIGRAGVNKL